MNQELRPYLTASALTHAGLLLALVILGRRVATTPQEVYRIDFIGPTAGILNRDPEPAGRAAAAPAGRPPRVPPPQAKPDEFARRRRGAPLPRPSFLSSAEPPPEAPTRPGPALAPREAAFMPSRTQQAAEAAAGDGSGASISAEMPNFPYPWYITEVRRRLWERWSARMPSGAGETLVMFTLLRGGALTDLRVESSSGDSAFDLAALTAVQESAPFAPLPPAFRERFLKVHVRFTAH